jgi:NADP-dependent 3-hydroxy acid dehydrogenase YdfG
MDSAGQHVVITGASTGIGKAAAARVVRGGARVTLIARRGELLADLCAELGAGAGWAAADVGKQDQLIAALDSAGGTAWADRFAVSECRDGRDVCAAGRLFGRQL